MIYVSCPGANLIRLDLWIQSLKLVLLNHNHKARCKVETTTVLPYSLRRFLVLFQTVLKPKTKGKTKGKTYEIRTRYLKIPAEIDHLCAPTRLKTKIFA